MNRLQKCFLCMLVVTLVMSGPFLVKAESEKYEIYDVSNNKETLVSETNNFNDAKAIYKKELDNYDNLVLRYGDEVYDMEYGVLTFTNSDDDATITYKSLISNNTNYLNPSYAGEAAYVSRDSSHVYFRISGDYGYINQKYVQLHPIDTLNVRTSTYEINDGVLYHNINTNLDDDYYNYSFMLDENVNCLKEEGYYYSYDGVYFYNDFKKMIDDYRQDSYDNSINANNPYYNYYQYLPHRTYTNYTSKDIEEYFSDVLNFDGKIQFYDDLNLDSANDDVNLSQYYNEIKSFFGYECIYGSNALMMLSLSTHESAYGKSLLAFSRNNLFGHAAYDNDIERSASRYNNVDTSIYSHAKYYISKLYAGVHSSVYFGSNYGNKSSGMNVMYSSDPYWGEKCASVYFNYDRELGFKDKNAYCIGIIENASNINVYQDINLRIKSFSVSDKHNYSFTILEDCGNVYKIQSDNCRSDDYTYNPKQCIAYISKKQVDYLINEDKILTPEYKTVRYDFNEGKLHDLNKIDIIVPENKEVTLPSPEKDGYEFSSYKTKDDINIANYRQIKSIRVVSDFSNIIELDHFYNLKGGKIEVLYEGNIYKVYDINSNMIESFDASDKQTNTITINYHGVKCDYPVTVSEELKECDKLLKEKINKNIESYKKDGTYDINDLNYIKENLYKVDYRLGFEEIRYIDRMLLNHTRNKVNYHFVDSRYDVSISGLALGLEDPRVTNTYQPFKNTYYIRTNPISKRSKNRLENVAKAYGFEVEDCLNISVLLNLQEVEFDNPIVVQVKILDKKQDAIYTVYHLDENNNVVKCRTIQTNNYVSFVTRSSGDFMILTKDSANNFDIKDIHENISSNDSDPDILSLYMEGFALLMFIVYGVSMFLLNSIIEKENRKKWNVYKK